jgi:hypothetical protein
MLEDSVLLSREDKKKALDFFKAMKFDKPIPLSKVNDLNKFYKSIELVNYSIFINDYEIYIDNDCFVKVKPIVWDNEFLLFLSELKYNEKIRLNCFNDIDRVRNILTNIKDKYFPFFIFKIENGIIDNFLTDYFYKIQPAGWDKKDDRTLAEFESEFEGIILDCSGGFDNNCKLKFKSDLENLRYDIKEEIKNIQYLYGFCSVKGYFYTDYECIHDLDLFYFKEKGYIGYLVCQVKKIKTGQSKTGFKNFTLSIEDNGGGHDITFWDNIINHNIILNTVCVLVIEVDEYYNKFTQQTDQKLKIESFIPLLSKKDYIKLNTK